MRVDGHIYFNAINREPLPGIKRSAATIRPQELATGPARLFVQDKIVYPPERQKHRRKDSGRGNFKIGEYTVGDGFGCPAAANIRRMASR